MAEVGLILTTMTIQNTTFINESIMEWVVGIPKIMALIVALSILLTHMSQENIKELINKIYPKKEPEKISVEKLAKFWCDIEEDHNKEEFKDDIKKFKRAKFQKVGQEPEDLKDYETFESMEDLMISHINYIEEYLNWYYGDNIPKVISYIIKRCGCLSDFNAEFEKRCVNKWRKEIIKKDKNAPIPVVVNSNHLNWFKNYEYFNQYKINIEMEDGMNGYTDEILERMVKEDRLSYENVLWYSNISDEFIEKYLDKFIKYSRLEHYRLNDNRIKRDKTNTLKAVYEAYFDNNLNKNLPNPNASLHKEFTNDVLEYLTNEYFPNKYCKSSERKRTHWDTVLQ